MNKKIIYAAYGSNLLKERFFVYIFGGKYGGINYKGCKDKTYPLDRGYKFVPYKLYFAKKSSKWDYGGVAFISCEKNEKYSTLVRLWEISISQFDDIQEQEGEIWYNKRLFLGKYNSLDIYTITGRWEQEINKPSERYLNIIKSGIKEVTGWNDNVLNEYINRIFDYYTY